VQLVGAPTYRRSGLQNYVSRHMVPKHNLLPQPTRRMEMSCLLPRFCPWYSVVSRGQSSASQHGQTLDERLAEAEFSALDKDHDGFISAAEFEEWRLRNKPTVITAREMPREYWQLGNDALAIMAARGVQGAQQERMVREVMAVDNLSWEQAQGKLKEIKRFVTSGRTFLEIPYYTGVVVALAIGVLCIPMIFYLPTARWFNTVCVTYDIPEERLLATPFEVSIWSWSWMEPMIGTASFLLLVLQFSRAQMLKVRWEPYGSLIFKKQLRRLTQKYPQYSPMVMEDFLASL